MVKDLSSTGNFNFGDHVAYHVTYNDLIPLLRMESITASILHYRSIIFLLNFYLHL